MALVSRPKQKLYKLTIEIETYVVAASKEDAFDIAVVKGGDDLIRNADWDAVVCPEIPRADRYAEPYGDTDGMTISQWAAHTEEVMVDEQREAEAALKQLELAIKVER